MPALWLQSTAGSGRSSPTPDRRSRRHRRADRAADVLRDASPTTNHLFP